MSQPTSTNEIGRLEPRHHDIVRQRQQALPSNPREGWLRRFARHASQDLPRAGEQAFASCLYQAAGRAVALSPTLERAAAPATPWGPRGTLGRGRARPDRHFMLASCRRAWLRVSDRRFYLG